MFVKTDFLYFFIKNKSNLLLLCALNIILNTAQKNRCVKDNQFYGCT